MPLHTLAAPLIAPGVAGMPVDVTTKACADETPHAPVAVTVMTPLIAPVVTEMLAVFEVPAQPEGSVQV